MTLRQTIDNFLLIISESSRETYRNKIDVFYNFLKTEKNLNDSSYQAYLKGMKIEEIIESLDYYINNNYIKSQSVALHYISVVKRYFNYIYKDGIRNKDLIKSFGLSEENPDSFIYQIYYKINNDSRLEKKDTKSELTQQEVEILIIECNQLINEIIEENKILEYNKYSSKYNDLMGSIIIKLIIYTGCTYNVVKQIKADDVKLVHNTIGINGYYIHLPNKLSEQIAYYYNLRKTIQEKTQTSNDKLFICSDGNGLGKNTYIVADMMKEHLGRSDITGIVKFAVINMISKGINQSILHNFTGVKKDIYNYCQEKVNENKNLSVSRYLDSKLRSIEIFDIL